MTAYIVLMLLMPYINIIIRNLDKKSHQKLLIILFIITSLIPTMPGGPASIISDVGFYLFIYLVGIYLRRYPDNKFNDIKLNFIAAVVLLIALTGTVIVFDILGTKHSFFAGNTGYFLRMSSPLVIFWVLSVFGIFRNIKMKSNKLINYISGSVLGVYLIHNNKNIRYTMWEIIFKDVRIESPYLSVHMLLAVIGIFVICVLIDILRRKIIEEPLFRFCDKRFDL
ncbi:MAG: acyltransferase [Butyrivibrio sp.]|nr:acyltransferase [Butyrivibrio sp.]